MEQTTQVEQKSIALSSYTTVTVNDSAQVQFTVTPTQDFMEKTCVCLSSTAWVSFCNSARSKVHNLIQSNGQETWMYHPNSKFVTVKPSGQVFFETFNRKGKVMKDHSVYLSAEEWSNLDDNIDNVNKLLDEVWSTKNKSRSCKSMMTMYKWKFTGPAEEGQNHAGFVHYLDKQTAKEAAVRYQEHTAAELGPMELISVSQSPLDPLKFMKLVYHGLLYKTVEYIMRQEFLEEDQVDYAGEKPSPEPISSKRLEQFALEHYDMLHEIITDDVVEDVFLTCWKRMKLPMTDARSHINIIHIVLSDREMVAKKVHDVGCAMKSDPQCLLMSSVWDEKDVPHKIASYIYENRPVIKKKKAKLQIGSDTESE